jgi:hypothetical protein
MTETLSPAPAAPSAGSPGAEASETAPLRAPYPGLRAFERDEVDLFFGREDCIDLMVDRLARTRFLAVLGASGSGKSSLVKTGLIRALRRGEHPTASHRWRIAEMRPEAEPLRNLAKALLAATRPEAPSDDSVDVDVLAGFLSLSPDALIEWMDDGAFPQGWNLLIVVDQFEELFRYKDYAQREDRDAFIRMLLHAAAEPSRRVSIVLTMRSEFLDACSLYPALSRKIGDGLFVTSQMTLDGIREAIERPALRVGARVQPELVDRLLDDLGRYTPWERAETSDEAEQLARQADQLPLMQHALSRMWGLRTRGAGAELTLEDYVAIGGVEDSLNRHAAEVLAGLKARFGEATNPNVGRVFRALVAGPSLSLAVRRLRSIKQLQDETGLPLETVREVVKAFAGPSCAFLRISKPEAGDEARVDLAHESLIRKWSLLSTWFAQEVTEGVNWTRLVLTAAPKGGAVTLPLSGAELGAYNGWWRERSPTAKWAERYGGEFEKASQFLKRANHLQALARLGVMALVVAVVLAVGGGIAWVRFEQYRQDEAEFDRKAQAAQVESQFERVKAAAMLISTQVCAVLDAKADKDAMQRCTQRYFDQFIAQSHGSPIRQGGTGCAAGQRPVSVRGVVTCTTSLGGPR